MFRMIRKDGHDFCIVDLPLFKHFKQKVKQSWSVWAKALGEKASNDSKTADKVALIRTAFVVLTVITEIHIIANYWMTHG